MYNYYYGVIPVVFYCAVCKACVVLTHHMSEQVITKLKRGAPKKKVTKVRQNITINRAVLKAGQKLAFKSGISFSAWLEKLAREQLTEEAGQ